VEAGCQLVNDDDDYDDDDDNSVNVYGAVIMAQPLLEFTRFTAPGGHRPLVDQDKTN